MYDWPRRKPSRGLFQSHVIGLFLNAVPSVAAIHDEFGAAHAPDLLQAAEDLGDQVGARLAERLTRLNHPAEIRRIDFFSEDAAEIASRQARSADTFVALRPNGASQEPKRPIDSVLFGSGRHLFLVPDGKQPATSFSRVVVAWNGSRESARALSEAMPYLHKAQKVTVVVVGDEKAT
jgi:hypothetical protein